LARSLLDWHGQPWSQLTLQLLKPGRASNKCTNFSRLCFSLHMLGFTFVRPMSRIQPQLLRNRFLPSLLCVYVKWARYKVLNESSQKAASTVTKFTATQLCFLTCLLQHFCITFDDPVRLVPRLCSLPTSFSVKVSKAKEVPPCSRL
jgi:hypothetical protein